jgi:hypothetical protein
VRERERDEGGAKKNKSKNQIARSARCKEEFDYKGQKKNINTKRKKVNQINEVQNQGIKTTKEANSMFMHYRALLWEGELCF